MTVDLGFEKTPAGLDRIDIKGADGTIHFITIDGSGNLNQDAVPLLAGGFPTIDAGGQVFSVKASYGIFQGAKGNGSTDDTLAVQSAITAAGNSGIVFFPPGNYLCQALAVAPATGLQLPTLLGCGPEKSIILASPSLAGPLLTVNPVSFSHNFLMSDLYLNANGIGQTGLFIANSDFGRLRNVEVRGATYGVDCGNVQGWTFSSLRVFNCSASFVRLNSATCQTLLFEDLFCYMTSSASSNATSLFEIAATAGDLHFNNCRLWRAPGIAFTVAKGLWVHLASPANAYIFANDLNVDSISTGISDDATCAAIWLENATACRFINSWASANAVADGTINPIMRIKGCNLVTWIGGWLSGRGVVFDAAAISDHCSFSDALWSNASTTGMFIMPGSNAPTNLTVRGCGRDHGVSGVTVPLTNLPGTLYTALTTKSDFFGYQPRTSRPVAALYDEPDIVAVANNASLIPATGTIYGFATYLPAGLTISNITFFTGATALILGTTPHLWVGIADSAFLCQAVSADNTAAVWAANAPLTTALTAPYTTPSDGIYYVLLMIVSGAGGTQPSLASLVGLAGLAALGFKRNFSASGGNTVPLVPTVTVGAQAGISQAAYHYVS